jgi:hypothetical protein
MMHYWNLLWDWDNLDAVRQLHSFLEGWALIFFALLVLFDALAHLAEENKPRAKILERIGLVCFAVAVLAECLAYPYSLRNDTLSERTIVSLSGLAGAADAKARQALGDSSVAITQAKKAVDASGQAKTSASSALVLSRGAREEADSFEKDIVSAKKQATEAEAHLAEALQRAANAEKQASRASDKVADRHLTPEQCARIAGKLRPFGGQTADLYMYSGESEIGNFAQDLAPCLTATWRILPASEQPRRAIPGMLVELRRDDDGSRIAASALVEALKNEGLAIVGPFSIGNGEGHMFNGNGDMTAPIVITIGKKP